MQIGGARRPCDPARAFRAGCGRGVCWGNTPETVAVAAAFITNGENHEKFPHHSTVRTVCTYHTQASFVTQLRGWLPAPIGAVVWVSLRSPCSSVFVPWYGGVSSFPMPYVTGTDTLKQGSAWWAFDNLAKVVDGRYAGTNAAVKAGFAALEQRELAEQPKIDGVAAILWKDHQDLAIWWITKASSDYGMQAYGLAQSLLTQVGTPIPASGH